MTVTQIAAAAAQVVCGNHGGEPNIDSRAALGISAAAAVMAFAATRSRLGFTPLLVASGLQAALFAGTLYMTVGRFSDCEERVNVYSPGSLWDEMSGVSGDTIDSPISAAVDASKHPISHWIFTALSNLSFYFFGIPMNIRQLVFVVCALALAAPVSGTAIASVGIVGCLLAIAASFIYEFPVVTAARLVNATLIGPYVLAFHAVANVITWLASLLPWLVDGYLAGMLIFTALCAVATIMLRCVVKLPHLQSLRTGILQQMFVLATQWLLQLPSWHPIWLAMLPVMHRTGNSEPPPSTTLRVLGARLAIPPAMAAAVGLHARGSKADQRTENAATAGASSIWRLVYSACLSITTVLGRTYIFMEVLRYFPWLLPAPARALLTPPGSASPTPDVQPFTAFLLSEEQLETMGLDGMMPPDDITQDIGSAAYFSLQYLGTYLFVPMASVPGFEKLAAACLHRVNVLQLALKHPAFASTLNGVARFLLGCAMCAFGAKWGRRLIGVRQGWSGLVPVLVMPALTGINLAYIYGASIGESLVVAVAFSVVMAYLKMLPQCQGIIRRTAVERAARRLNQHWSKHRLASELTGMVVVAIVAARIVLGAAASFFGAVLIVREWPRALWWMRVTLAGQTLALDAAPRLHHLSPALAGSLVTAVAACAVLWKVVCLQQQHRVRAPQYSRALATLLDWPSGEAPPHAQENGDGLRPTGDGSEHLSDDVGAMDLYDIAETWSEGSVDLSVAADLPSPHMEDDSTNYEPVSPRASASSRHERRSGGHSVWWSDAGSDDVSSALGWWRRQGAAPGVQLGRDGASEGGSSGGGILSGMSQLFEGVAMGQAAVGGLGAAYGAMSETGGSDPDPSMAQAGDPAYADSDGATLRSAEGESVRETNSRSSGLRGYAQQFHSRHGRQGTAMDSGEIVDSTIDKAMRGGFSGGYLGSAAEQWQLDFPFNVGRAQDDDDDDDTASVVSAATMAGTSRKEARRHLRRRHTRSRSTGRSRPARAPSAASRDTAGQVAQRRARTSVQDEDCAPAAGSIECDAPSVLYQQMTPSVGPISGAVAASASRDLDELSLARGQRSPAPGRADTTSSGSQRFPLSVDRSSAGYAYSPWGRGADIPTGGGFVSAPPPSNTHSMPAAAQNVGIALGSGAAHRPHYSEPVSFGALQPSQDGRPPLAAKGGTGGPGHLLAALSQGASPSNTAHERDTSLSIHAPAATPTGSEDATAVLPVSNAAAQRFPHPSPLPPITMQSQVHPHSQPVAHAAPLSAAERPSGFPQRLPAGGIKRIRGHSADSEAFDVDLTGYTSNSRSMESAATAPAGLISTGCTPLPLPTPIGETASKKPRQTTPPQPMNSTGADTGHAVYTSAAGSSSQDHRSPPPPSVAPPTPPSSVAAAASTAHLSVAPPAVEYAPFSLDEALLQASASVAAPSTAQPLLASHVSASITKQADDEPSRRGLDSPQSSRSKST